MKELLLVGFDSVLVTIHIDGTPYITTSTKPSNDHIIPRMGQPSKDEFGNLVGLLTRVDYFIVGTTRAPAHLGSNKNVVTMKRIGGQVGHSRGILQVSMVGDNSHFSGTKKRTGRARSNIEVVLVPSEHLDELETQF